MNFCRQWIIIDSFAIKTTFCRQRSNCWRSCVMRSKLTLAIKLNFCSQWSSGRSKIKFCDQCVQGHGPRNELLACWRSNWTFENRIGNRSKWWFNDDWIVLAIKINFCRHGSKCWGYEWSFAANYRIVGTKIRRPDGLVLMLIGPQGSNCWRSESKFD